MEWAQLAADCILNADFEVLIPDHVLIIQANPASGDYNDERDGADSAEFTTRLGSFAMARFFSETCLALAPSVAVNPDSASL